MSSVGSWESRGAGSTTRTSALVATAVDQEKISRSSFARAAAPRIARC
jgi:hypothetical protein